MICITNSKGYKRTLERDLGKNEHAVERAEPFPNFWSPPERGSEGKNDGNASFIFLRESMFSLTAQSSTPEKKLKDVVA